MPAQLVQKVLIDNICKQVYICIQNSRFLAPAKEHRLIKLESLHLDMLLELLRSEMSISTYLTDYALLFSDEELQNYRASYTPQVLFLEKEQADMVRIDDEEHLFVDILQICSDNIKKHIDAENYDAIRDEAYYNHNVPSLISSKNKDLIDYYLSIECKGCRSYCPKEMSQSYESVWQQISETFSIKMSMNCED